MPDSNLMKKALAQSFKELVKRHPFEKVGVNDICEACQVSRKTFYYHFQDKYALMEWIFQTEFISAVKSSEINDLWTLAESLCRYLSQERDYYAKLMQFRGQNSFRQYFLNFLLELVEQFVMPGRREIDLVAEQSGVTAETARSFFTRFFAGAAMYSAYCWLDDGAKQPPEVFVNLLRTTENLIYLKINQQTGKEHQMQAEA